MYTSHYKRRLTVCSVRVANVSCIIEVERITSPQCMTVVGLLPYTSPPLLSAYSSIDEAIVNEESDLNEHIMTRTSSTPCPTSTLTRPSINPSETFIKTSLVCNESPVRLFFVLFCFMFVCLHCACMIPVEVNKVVQNTDSPTARVDVNHF